MACSSMCDSTIRETNDCSVDVNVPMARPRPTAALGWYASECGLIAIKPCSSLYLRAESMLLFVSNSMADAASLNAAVRKVIAPVLIGVIVHAFLLGVCSAQYVTYFTSRFNDHKFIVYVLPGSPSFLQTLLPWQLNSRLARHR